MARDIFVTGAGIVSALGDNKSETLSALQGRHTGIAPVRYLGTSHTEFPVGEVKMSNAELMSRLGIADTEVVTRSSLMGKFALREALEQAALHDRQGLRVALISGTTVGGMEMTEQYYLQFFENDTKNAYIATHDCGACTEMIAD
jgi:3-oxoacyl-[acyl-carrier-protein] synthase-1